MCPPDRLGVRNRKINDFLLQYSKLNKNLLCRHALKFEIAFGAFEVCHKFIFSSSLRVRVIHKMLVSMVFELRYNLS